MWNNGGKDTLLGNLYLLDNSLRHLFDVMGKEVIKIFNKVRK